MRQAKHKIFALLLALSVALFALAGCAAQETDGGSGTTTGPPSTTATPESTPDTTATPSKTPESTPEAAPALRSLGEFITELNALFMAANLPGDIPQPDTLENAGEGSYVYQTVNTLGGQNFDFTINIDYAENASGRLENVKIGMMTSTTWAYKTDIACAMLEAFSPGMIDLLNAEAESQKAFLEVLGSENGGTVSLGAVIFEYAPRHASDSADVIETVSVRLR